MKLSNLMKTGGLVFLIMTLCIAWSIYNLNSAFESSIATAKEEAELKQLSLNIREASDYLTDQMRRFTINGDRRFRDNYWREVNETKTRDKVIARLVELKARPDELELLEVAKKNSDNLINREAQAEKAVLAGDLRTARELMYGDGYDREKAIIVEPINQFQKKIYDRASLQTSEAYAKVVSGLYISGIFICLIVFVIAFMLVVMIRRVGVLKILDEKMQELANSKGDLTTCVSIEGADEISSLSSAANRFLESLRRIIIDIAGCSSHIMSEGGKLVITSKDTKTAVENIRNSLMQITDMSKHNSQALKTCSKNLSVMLDATTQVSNAASQGTSAIVKTEQVSEKAVKMVKDVITKMNNVNLKSQENEAKIKQLTDSVGQISGFADVITSIAKQTNLLALNATIEAARAGDVGKGFAVVAEEVRKLAEESAQTADKVAGITNQLQQDTNVALIVTGESTTIIKDMLSQADEAQRELNLSLEDMEKVREAIQKVDLLTEQLVKTNEEILSTLNQATEATISTSEKVQIISEDTDKTSIAAESVEGIAGNVSKEVDSMQHLVSQFKV